mmetsp:Transcript_25697/g.55293  ORF Transcript_25697/g.55293 Transcript_25697/m.55293 type:complete len:370 (-) Transcript_25697:231-1340(-)|eukprot:CAMPEP_0172298632 /NCGR_PEP_ID=MMETSP1058-20130122/1197_1 /TAXON_ID=83371 /ORGANISM="Detonula confervacea, Strain CCMP 353" /LENGTH=369 /DNA_ID=CAMNT_0013007913 /DNA_START=11 /DNA_END=1120 /DNA_ORIENTATION=+
MTAQQMKSLAMLAPWLAVMTGGSVMAFCPGQPTSRLSTTVLSSKQNDSRRSFLSKTLSTLPYVIPISANAASVPVQRAVGAAEEKCREEGNCLEKFDLDGAVGWSWGAKERCDASDPLCGADGQLREEALSGQSVPAKDSDLEITDVVELTLKIGTGSNSDTQTMKIGLYGNRCPELVKEMTDMCGRTGIITSKDLLLGSPVKLGQGGSVTYMFPDERLEFGVSSQKIAYARSMRLAKAPDEFVPQSRPSGKRLETVRGEQSSRKHDVAGLISVPKDGIGYGGGLLPGKDDEAYASAFQVTAKAMPEMDKEGRKVIGQILDSKSMDVLARIAGSPTRKMTPLQVGGTPLSKVIVGDCSIYSAADLVAKE